MAYESVSLQVVECVADLENVAPSELSVPIADVIDPDALDTLFRNTTGQLTFEYHGYTVSVDSEGTVEVTSLD
jgi:hypothetical protein